MTSIARTSAADLVQEPLPIVEEKKTGGVWKNITHTALFSHMSYKIQAAGGLAISKLGIGVGFGSWLTWRKQFRPHQVDQTFIEGLFGKKIANVLLFGGLSYLLYLLAAAGVLEENPLTSRFDVIPLLCLPSLLSQSFREGYKEGIRAWSVWRVFNEICPKSVNASFNPCYTKHLMNLGPSRLIFAQPTIEELEYRGLLLGGGLFALETIFKIVKGRNPSKEEQNIMEQSAIYFSAIWFSYSHLGSGSVQQLIYAAFDGLAYGKLAVDHGLIAPIAAHMASNTFGALALFRP